MLDGPAGATVQLNSSSKTMTQEDRAVHQHAETVHDIELRVGSRLILEGFRGQCLQALRRLEGGSLHSMMTRASNQRAYTQEIAHTVLSTDCMQWPQRARWLST